MNTAFVRKEAIALQLGELISHACKYSPDTPARYGTIEPDIYALFQFMDEISRLAKLHFNNELNEKNTQVVLDFCYEIGKKVGHVFSNGSTTGTWSNRIHGLLNIQKILRLRDFDLPKVGTVLELYGIPSKITRYEVSETWLWISYEPLDSEINGFQVSLNWNELNNWRI